VWLNIAPDHLDWHVSMSSYVGAKQRIWASAKSDDIAVAPAFVPSILDAARASRARLVTFGAEDADYSIEGDKLFASGAELIDQSRMKRSLPHDVTNALAASAAVLETGAASVSGVVEALETFTPSHHRIEFVAAVGGISWYDDSKATSPHAASTALRAFPSIVLIAGGRNKGLDLSQLVAAGQAVKAVVGIGESGPEIARHFSGRCPTVAVESMVEAVDRAAAFASDGDVVLLSPACTSFDWYRNYEERGRDFVRCVKTKLGLSLEGDQ
jgi:UDP-N-acetylmuramoylalanine--D-glutamate ligase